MRCIQNKVWILVTSLKQICCVKKYLLKGEHLNVHSTQEHTMHSGNKGQKNLETEKYLENILYSM